MPAAARVYFEFGRRGFRRYAAYPAATVAGIFTNSVFGFIRGYVLLALYRERASVGGYDAAETLTYVWLTQGLATTVLLWGWSDVARRINTGDIATDLVRPVDLQLSGLAFDLGRSLYHALFRGVPPVVVGALAFDLIAPADAIVAGAFAASVVLAVGISYAFRFIYNAAAFWVLDYRGPMIVATTLVLFFSGMLIPVRFFPDWLEAVAYALPFVWMIQGPVDIFVGETTGAEIAGTLGAQAAWVVALLGLGRIALGAGTRKLVVQGG